MIILDQLPHMAELMPDVRVTCKHIKKKNHNPEQIYSLGLMPAVDPCNHYPILVSKSRWLDTSTEEHVEHMTMDATSGRYAFLAITTVTVKPIKVFRIRMEK